MSTPSGPFTYVFIPADESKPVESRVGDKSGGLGDDFLSKEAKRYFFEQSDGAARAAALDNATPEERKALAEKIREQALAASAASGGSGDAGAASHMSKLDDDALINIMRSTHTSASCEIIALTVPTPSNDHHAVSLYAADDARTRNLPLNARATALMKACGHALPPDEDGSAGGVCGDVFVGRCRDDEAADVWERVDFMKGDADPGALWCMTAREKGGGGGGGAAAPSLSGLMSGAINRGALSTSIAGNERISDGYRWSQTDDEVEIKFAVAKGTKAKYVKVSFERKTLKVTVAGQTLVNGATGGEVDKEDCTFTIQDDVDSATGRELCVTLGKRNASSWEFAVQ